MIDGFVFKDVYGIDDLLQIMRCLRSEGGCPWDREQTHESIKKNLIEETYEVIEAINKQDRDLLCEELGVSRTALRAAITRLISCGTLESRRGSGTYVCPPKPLNIFQETWNYTQAVERVGSKSTARLIWSKVVYADIDLAQKAQIDLGMPLFCIRRVRVVNGSPASIETAYVNLSLCPSLPDHDFEQESLYDVLLKEGNVHVTHGKEHISISRLNADEAKLLGAQEGTPVFYKASHERDETDGFVEYCKSVILPTKYRFADNGEADGVATKVGVEWLMQ